MSEFMHSFFVAIISLRKSKIKNAKKPAASHGDTFRKIKTIPDSFIQSVNNALHDLNKAIIFAAGLFLIFFTGLIAF